MSALLKEVMGTDAMAGAPADDSLPVVAPGAWSDGVDTLVHLLRHPELTHIWPVCELPVSNKAPVDWSGLGQRLTAVFDHQEMRCVEAYLMLRLALAVLKMKDVALCKGPVEIRFWQDECGFPNVTFDLTVDTDSYRAVKLSDDLRSLTLACHGGPVGVIVRYQSAHPYDPGHWPPRPAWNDDDCDDEE